ncbi:MAG: hypothetical protein ABII90_10780 [Bacteroidota bacterium]
MVNQTTMLATETKEIATFLKSTMIGKYGMKDMKSHFADTRDTLCYATNDSQEATRGLLKLQVDMAIVVGGYNSSNTSHLVELCESRYTGKTYYISSAKEILSGNLIRHYDHRNDKMKETKDFLPKKQHVDIILTSGASCPDATVDEVLQQILSFFEDAKSVDDVLGDWGIKGLWGLRDWYFWEIKNKEKEKSSCF